jgi:hypothetical protein
MRGVNCILCCHQSCSFLLIYHRVFIISLCLFLFTCFSLPQFSSCLIHHVWKFKNHKKLSSFFSALRSGAGCNVDRLSLLSGHLKH